MTSGLPCAARPAAVNRTSASASLASASALAFSASWIAAGESADSSALWAARTRSSILDFVDSAKCNAAAIREASPVFWTALSLAASAFLIAAAAAAALAAASDRRVCTGFAGPSTPKSDAADPSAAGSPLPTRAGSSPSRTG